MMRGRCTSVKIEVVRKATLRHTVPSDMWPIILHFWPYNMRYKAHYFLYILSDIAAVTAGGVLSPLFVRQFIDALKEGDTAELYSAIMIIGILALLFVAAKYAADWFIIQVSPRVMRDVENDCFNRIHLLPVSFFAETQGGSTVAKVKRFSSAYNTLDLHLSRGILETVFQLLCTIIAIGFFSLPLAGVFLVWGVLYIVVLIAAIQRKMRLDVIRARIDSKTTGILADSILNFMTVKIFSRMRSEKELFRIASEDTMHAQQKSWMASTIISLAQNTLIGAANVAILLVAVQLWQRGMISVGTIVLVQTYAFIVSSHFLQMSEQLKAIYRAVADCVEMMEILAINPTVSDSTTPEKSHIKKGAIDFNAIEFSYDPQTPLFEKLSLYFPAGQRTGLVGHSGAGKSTLTALILRFMDVQGGSITIDGQDIRTLTQDDLRRAISYVPQDPVLFHRSIRENIAYAKPDATQKEIEAAARNAYAHEFIKGFPEGYDTVVGERGIRLSGGERQRIAIARAMLKNAPILVLDEATSSLDSVSEKYIREAFDTLVKNRTTIVIAHRLSTIQKMDRIIVIEDGKAMEDGTHTELLRKKGLYAELWKHQTNGFIGE